MRLLVLFSLVCFLSQTLLSTWAQSTGSYRVGIANHVAFTPPSTSPMSAQQIKQNNLDIYSAIVQTAADYAETTQVPIHLVTFPEFGLIDDMSGNRSYVEQFAEPLPDPSFNPIIPCDDPHTYASTAPALFTASCLASKYQLRLMWNVFEVAVCSTHSPFYAAAAAVQSAERVLVDNTDASCPADGHNIYVTDIVLDETGALVRKYRKSHPFFISSINAPSNISVVSYSDTTSTPHANMTFGLFICFDIAFTRPASDLLAEGIKHYLYSAAQSWWGKAIVVKAWSFLHKAVVVFANLGLDVSAFYVNGSELAFQKVPLSSSPHGTPDSLLVADIPY